MRTFDTGATRSPIEGKLQYEGYLNPLVVRRFAQYMKKHQTDASGNQREADNWQKGIPKSSLMDSGYRHFMDWWTHHRGYSHEVAEDVQDSLCALIFNAMAYLKADLDENEGNRNAGGWSQDGRMYQCACGAKLFGWTPEDDLCPNCRQQVPSKS